MRNLFAEFKEVLIIASDEKEFNEICQYLEKTFDVDKDFEYWTCDLDYSIRIRFISRAFLDKSDLYRYIDDSLVIDKD